MVINEERMKRTYKRKSFCPQTEEIHCTTICMLLKTKGNKPGIVTNAFNPARGKLRQWIAVSFRLVRAIQ